jgi:LIVCS family branched-chain amino acid:cation transporter
MKTKQIVSLGIALFAMFFGAGNVVFPLDVGRMMGDSVPLALVGLFLSGVLMPLVGVFACAFFEGDYKEFFGRIGTMPGELLILVCMLTIGSLGAIPRTLTLSHSAFSWYFPSFPLWIFTILAGIIILIFTLSEGKVVDVIGKYLGPIKIVLLSSVIISGFLTSSELIHTDFTAWQSFAVGLFEGYGTLDLLGAIFFAKLIILSVGEEAHVNKPEFLKGLLKAGVIGAGLLGIIYSGFMVTSAMHSSQIGVVGRDQLIFALGDFLLGRLGILVSFTVAIACLTTAIALTAVFSDYLSKDLLRGKISYKVAVVLNVFTICAFANLGFEGIMRVVVPIAAICYPSLIVLSLVNIAYKTVGFKPVKIPVYATFILTVARYIGAL